MGALGLLAAAIAAVLSLAGCRTGGEGGGEGVTLRFWGLGREGEVVAQLAPEFERENPGVHVAVQQIPWTAAHEKLLTAYVGDATPDVAQIGNSWIAEFAALRAVRPLDDLVARSAVARPDRFFRGAWESNVVGSRTYGLPWYVDTRVVFYRPDLLKRAGYDSLPQTWSGWLDAMERVKALVGPGKYAILVPTTEWAPPVVLALQAGSTLLKDGGRWGAFEEPAFRRAYDFYLGIFRRGLAPPVASSEVSNVFQEFARGAFAMYITGPWNMGEFERQLPPGTPWATAPMPGPDGPGVSMAGGSSLVIFRGSAHQAEAWRLLEYLSRPEVQLRFYHLTGDLPAVSAAWGDTSLIGNRYARAFWEQLQRLEPLPKVPEIEDISIKLQDATESIVRGGVSEAAALRRLDAQVDQILAKRRWLLTQDSARAAASGGGVRRGAPARPGGLGRRAMTRVGGVSEANARAAWMFLAPALALIAIFFFLPIAAAFLLSFTDFDIYAIADLRNVRVVGFGNYARLLSTADFWHALRITLYFALVGGPLSVAASLAAALLLNAKAVRLKSLFRTIYFAPFVTTLVAVAIVWRYLYHPRYGLIDFALGKLGLPAIDWLGDPHWAMPAIILLAVWKNFGYNMLVFIAGLQTIPEELYEAAELDGAGAWRRFWSVTFPMLGPTLLFVGVITMIGYLQLFAEPYVMTQGGPVRATTSVVLYMYEEGFRWWRMGFAAAIAFVLFIVILLATLVQFRLGKQEAR